MAHIIVEYTDNLKEQGDIQGLLKKINTVLIAQDGVFPTGGIRSRAIELKDYYIADGEGPDDAFVHVTFKMGGGRSETVKKAASDALFEMIEQHFAHIFEQRPLALSMERYEFGGAGTYKKNRIHDRYG
ncbi:5-carboxymethyl-2-hydroxymuconate Delta-isomerase [Lentibacillus sp. JNUCC-1]|uniref:5-carboxymethyl-2-hydroxymuconate Delta-isomerase n=1 Tax=Lentibacillus sp. JNUCC-1 TaxID=2654513 RepID=UPI00132579B4|nr:5-carboxymethyl-2-hydroxymuconate Delta-isomerase [Lentibacillus sp. JNUCC-1]